MKKVFIVCLILSLLFCVTACNSNSSTNDTPDTTNSTNSVESSSSSSDSEDLELDKDVYSCAASEFETLVYLDEAGNPTGFEIELLYAIAEDQGFDVDIEMTSFDQIVGNVQTGVNDIGIGGIGITDKRQESVNFSESYLDEKDTERNLVLVTDISNKHIYSKDDLGGKVCGIYQYSGYDELMDLNSSAAPGKIINYESGELSNLISSLENGDLDCAILSCDSAETAINNSGARIAGDFSCYQYGLVVSKDNDELLDKINNGLKNVINSGEYDRILNKYFDK